MNAVILAAGKGTRLKEITKTVPKPLLRVRGEPILAHQLDMCARAGVKNLFINTHYLADQIREFAGDGSRFGLNISYSFEPELLGTAGALKNFRENLMDGDFFLLYGDNYVDLDLAALAKFHTNRSAIATIAVHPRDDVSDSGAVELNAENRVTRFVEKQKSKEPKSGLVNAGIYALNPKVFDYIPAGFSDFGFDIFPKLIAGGQPVLAYKIDKELIAIDTPELYAAALEKFPH